MRSAFMRARKAQAASSYQSSFPPGEQLWGQRGWEEGSLQAQDCGASSRLGPTLPVAGGVTASLHEANLLSLTCWPFLNPFLLMDIFLQISFDFSISALVSKASQNTIVSEVRDKTPVAFEKKEEEMPRDLYTNWPFCHFLVCLSWGLIQGPWHPWVLDLLLGEIVSFLWGPDLQWTSIRAKMKC